MKELLLAHRMYADDNHDYLAFCNWDGGGVEPGAGWLYWNENGGGIPDPTKTGAAAYNSGLWYHYVGNPKSYLCPKDLIVDLDYTQRANKLSTYVMNGAPEGFDAKNSFQTCKTTQVWSPLCYLIWEPDVNTVGPENPGVAAYNDGANLPVAPPLGKEGLGPLHNNSSGNIGRLDGGVQSMDTNMFSTISLQPVSQSPGPGGKNLLWWSVWNLDGLDDGAGADATRPQ
jgi:hypothetical protein